MVSIDRFAEILDDVACEFPPEFFNRLNGGIQIDENAKRHPKAAQEELYILGEYCASRELGRSIQIYYGSFAQLYPHASEELLRMEMRKTLRHEFRHHMESLSGEWTLAEEDDEKLEAYLENAGS